MRKLVVGTLTVAAFCSAAGTAQAVPPLVDGKTAAVHDYTQAIRERVFIPQPGIDQDRNGAMDWITADIIRPNTTDKVPAIIHPTTWATSPTSVGILHAGCLGRERECMADFDNDGVNDRWPLWYDNYFVPRGYAYILGQANGTGYSEHGCTLLGGPGDIAGEKSIVDWLNGRVAGFSAADVSSAPKTAGWHDGSSAMIGQGFDGGLVNGVAATGVEGLKTAVPINGVSNWHEIWSPGGAPSIRDIIGLLYLMNLTNGPAPPPGVNLPNRRPACLPVRQSLIDPANADLGIGAQHGDVNTFWRERDYTRNTDKVKASVLIAHSQLSETFRTYQAYPWWRGLATHGVPRKLWISRHGLEDIFDIHRARWVETLHRWFDHWLYGVQNGIMSEPPVSIENERGVWSDFTDWPVAGTRDVDLYLRAGADAGGAGTLGSVAGGGMLDSVGYTTSAGEADLHYGPDPTGPQINRRVFLSAPLTRDVVISGQPRADIRASLGARTTLGLLITDQGTDDRLALAPQPTFATRSCWGATSAGDACPILGATCTAAAQTVETACYLDTNRQSRVQTWYRVGRGVLDPENRTSLNYGEAEPVVPDQSYRFPIASEPTQYTIKAGHRIGVVIHGPDFDWMNASGGGSLPRNVPVTLDTRTSKLTLPVVGGYEALAEAGAFDDPTASVGGTVPATLSLTLGAPASFGAFVPGVTLTYAATTTANVISSAGDAALSVSDPSPNATGHLVNGAFTLPQPLQGLGTVKTWTAPTSNEAVTIAFQQPIGATDALRTGSYSKTLTFTLSTSAP
jgi:X-Pro dipeptidyl-peptidase